MQRLVLRLRSYDAADDVFSAPSEQRRGAVYDQNRACDMDESAGQRTDPSDSGQDQSQCVYERGEEELPLYGFHQPG